MSPELSLGIFIKLISISTTFLILGPFQLSCGFAFFYSTNRVSVDSARNSVCVLEHTVCLLTMVKGGLSAVIANSDIETSGNCTNNSASGDGELTSLLFPDEALAFDSYSGVTIDVSKLRLSNYYDEAGVNIDVDVFQTTLNSSLKMWKQEGNRGIWIHVPSKQSAIIPTCVGMGFEFQHAKKGLLVLTKWLPENCASRLPNGPSHQVGVGALVIHPVTGKMLVVQEKSGPASVHNLWKMPTGLTDQGEDIAAAVVREVKEETGLDVQFDRIVCLREAHGMGAFASSDMFFVCLVTLDSRYKDALMLERDDIPLVAQEEEIAMIRWMDVDEYSNQELWNKSPLYQEMNAAMKRVVKEIRKDTSVSGEKKPRQNDGKNDLHSALKHLDIKLNGRLTSGMICKRLPLGYKDGSNSIYINKA